MKVSEIPTMEAAAASPTNFNFASKLYDAVPASIVTGATDVYLRTAEAVPSMTSAVNSAVTQIVQLGEPIARQHSAVLESIDTLACQSLDSALNAIHTTAKTINDTRNSVETKVAATRSMVQTTVVSTRTTVEAHAAPYRTMVVDSVAQARNTVDTNLAYVERTALLVTAPLVIASVNVVDSAIDRLIPGVENSNATGTHTRAGTGTGTTTASTGPGAEEEAADEDEPAAPEYQFAPLPPSPSASSAERAAPPAYVAPTPFGAETRKLLKQIEAVCTKAQFRAKQQALVRVQYATARTEAVVAQLKTNTVDLLAYARQIGANGYGYVTSDEAVTNAKIAATNAQAVAVQMTAKASAASQSAVAQAEVLLPPGTVEGAKAAAKKAASLLTAYYAKGADLAEQHQMVEKVTEAATVFYGHVERLTRGEHRDRILAFLVDTLQKTEENVLATEVDAMTDAVAEAAAMAETWEASEAEEAAAAAKLASAAESPDQDSSGVSCEESEPAATAPAVQWTMGRDPTDAEASIVV